MPTKKSQISFRGYIIGERKSSPELSKLISELLDNCYEAFRVNDVGGEIDINFMIDGNILKSIEITDLAKSKTGVEDLENMHDQVSDVIIELKFIVIQKKIHDTFKKLFSKNQISLKNTFCVSYIKSLGIINKMGIIGYSSFIDIGLNKSSLTIFYNNKLLYLDGIYLGIQYF